MSLFNALQNCEQANLALGQVQNLNPQTFSDL